MALFGDQYTITKVRVHNRNDAITGSRLSLTKVMIDDQQCGQIQGSTQSDQWYEVTCTVPLTGSSVKLVTT